MESKVKHIISIEGEWEPNLKSRTSGEPLFRFLSDSMDVKYIFRKASVTAALQFYLKEFSKSKYQSYEIFYLGFHGESKRIFLHNKQSLSLDEFAEMAGSTLENKIVHFGSCRTFLTSQRELSEFRKKVKAKSVSGYTKNIDFVDSYLLDLAFLSLLQYFARPGDAANRLKKEHPYLFKNLGFKMLTENREYSK